MDLPAVLGSKGSNETPIRPLYSELGAHQVTLLSFSQEHFEWHMSLQVFTLDKCPPYAALSYRWGDATVLGIPYVVNQYTVQTPFNLSEALASLVRHVRLQKRRQSPHNRRTTTARRHVPFPYKYFWIDYLCINQEDVVKRGHQVQVMSKIFSSASCVLVHLADQACVAEMDLLEERYSNPRDTHDQAFAAFSSTHRDLLRPFMDENYWKRMWIVQELVLARETKIICSDRIMHLKALEEEFLKSVDGLENDIDEWSFSRIMRPLPNRSAPERDAGSFADLVEMLYYHRNSECSDARDRIYSLLSCID